MADENTPARSPPGTMSPPGSKSPPALKSPPARSPPGSKSPPAQGPEANPGGILPAEYWAQQEPVQDDSESALVESITSSTASVASSILNYRTLNGRRYHSEIGNANYWGSNDEAQSDSLDVNHHAMTLALGDKLYLAPLEKDKVHRALDIGTGTGIWAIDFADEFPEAEVIGTDISPIQPSWIPPNLKFEIEDCTQNWTFKPGTFDFVHSRWLLGSLADWDGFFAQAYRVCRPGGWCESVEPSCLLTSEYGPLQEDCALNQWGKFFSEGGKMIGRSFKVVEDDLQRKGMEAAGFVDIQDFVLKMPIGAWPKDPHMKELGTLNQVVLESDTEGYVLFIANTIGWSREEIQVYIAHLRRETRMGKHYPYYWVKVVWGRRPEDS